MIDPAAPASLVVNGALRPVAQGPDRSLLFALRDELGLTGAKPGCGEGACGACTVLLDGEPVKACQVHLSEVSGRTVRTVEGLAAGGMLHPVQQAFLEVGAFQCGYCTAGMVMSAVALLEREPDPDDAQVREALHPNVCRCCTYPRILRAVHRAAELTGRSVGDDRPGTGTPRLLAAAVADERLTDEWRPRLPWDVAPAAERDWFDALPPGLVAVHEPAPSHDEWTTSAGAWLHVGEDGAITAFTGKVDVGQDNRTALSVLVADALRVPLSAVRLVMGDTDLCPYDEGTFGSRSMPDAGKLLRRAAVGARATLVRLAAARFGVDPATLVAADGAVRDVAGSRTLAYEDLVRDLRLVERIDAVDDDALGGEAERLAGHPARRVTGPAIVTGVRRFPSDLSIAGMLHGRVLRPPVPGATLHRVDTAAAAALPGVTVVREDGFVGVVAPNPFLAGRALGQVAAEWDRPALPSGDGLVAWLREHPIEEEEGWGGPFHREISDVDAALEIAPTYLAATYTTAYIAHVPLETRVALAAWHEDGRLTVWTGTQVPFGVRAEVAEELGLPEERVRVITPDTGGGFGGKHAAGVAIEAARLARAVGRPVKVRWTRPEEFTEGHLRPAAVIDVRSGADGEAITAWEMRNTNSGMFGLVGPYTVPSQRLDFQPAGSPLRQGSYRALAATANHFARESHMDELAAAMGLDPLDLRLKHLADERLADVLRAAADRIGWAEARGAGRGVGIACGVEKGARVATSVDVRVGEDRRLVIERVVTAFDCGAIVNPDGLTNQVEGAVVMGLGAALFEAIRFEAGVIGNASFADYRVPRIDDVPPVEVILLDRPEISPAGAGETPILAIAPAIANAIFAATGVRLRSIPLVPDGVVPG
jgi:nicotinate dehydrogenase subunit B